MANGIDEQISKADGGLGGSYNLKRFFVFGSNMHKNEVIWLWTKLISEFHHKLSHMHPIPGRTSRWCLVLTWLHRHLIGWWCRHVTDHMTPGRHKGGHTDCWIVRRGRQLLRVYLLVVHVLSIWLTIVRYSGGGGVLFNGFLHVSA